MGVFSSGGDLDRLFHNACVYAIMALAGYLPNLGNGQSLQ